MAYFWVGLKNLGTGLCSDTKLASIPKVDDAQVLIFVGKWILLYKTHSPVQYPRSFW